MVEAYRVVFLNAAAGKCRGVNSLVSEKAQADVGACKGSQKVNAVTMSGSVVGIFNVVALNQSGWMGSGFGDAIA